MRSVSTPPHDSGLEIAVGPQFLLKDGMAIPCRTIAAEKPLKCEDFQRMGLSTKFPQSNSYKRLLEDAYNTSSAISNEWRYKGNGKRCLNR
ncbi:hypothetical protein TNCV_4734181 [Trichonephila clavipes]|nr:hypothetical protein TNCV_4734181 [Trichonephila clavipes]